MAIQILQGTLDLMILRTLASMDPQHAHGIASWLQQVSEDALNLNPALIRIEQHGWTRGLSKTENNRDVKHYATTKAGWRAFDEDTERWSQMAGIIEKLFAEER